MDQTATTASADRGRPARADAALRIVPPLAGLLAAIILVQAFLAGRHLFGAWSITVHGVVGNIVFAAAAVLVVVALVGRAGRTVVAATVVLALVLTAQIGLGYSGRESLTAAAWHIPNGVLSFGLAVYLATRPLRRAGAPVAA